MPPCGAPAAHEKARPVVEPGPADVDAPAL